MTSNALEQGSPFIKRLIQGTDEMVVTWSQLWLWVQTKSKLEVPRVLLGFRAYQFPQKEIDADCRYIFHHESAFDILDQKAAFSHARIPQRHDFQQDIVSTRVRLIDRNQRKFIF